MDPPSEAAMPVELNLSHYVYATVAALVVIVTWPLWAQALTAVLVGILVTLLGVVLLAGCACLILLAFAALYALGVLYDTFIREHVERCVGLIVDRWTEMIQQLPDEQREQSPQQRSAPPQQKLLQQEQLKQLLQEEIALMQQQEKDVAQQKSNEPDDDEQLQEKEDETQQKGQEQDDVEQVMEDACEHTDVQNGDDECRAVSSVNIMQTPDLNLTPAKTGSENFEDSQQEIELAGSDTSSMLLPQTESKLESEEDEIQTKNTTTENVQLQQASRRSKIDVADEEVITADEEYA